MVLAYDRKFEIADFWPRPNAEGNVNIGLGGNHEGLGINPQSCADSSRFQRSTPASANTAIYQKWRGFWRQIYLILSRMQEDNNVNKSLELDYLGR